MARSIAIAAVLALSALGVPGVASAGNSPGYVQPVADFCGPRLATNFLRPLEKLLPIKQVPRSGKLPFAPRGLNLVVEGGRLVVGDGEVGFGFSDEAVGQVRKLNWTVSAELSRVHSGGRVLKLLRKKKVRIGALRGSHLPSLLFEVAGAPSIYRLDIRIDRIAGSQHLGTYSSYVRVVKPRFDARLLSSARVAQAGKTLSVRLANFGTETVTRINYNRPFSVQRFDGRDWVIAPSSPEPQKAHPLIQKLPAGQMEPCVNFTVPSGEEPGLYRFSMAVARSSTGEPRRTVELTSEFEIRG